MEWEGGSNTFSLHSFSAENVSFSPPPVWLFAEYELPNKEQIHWVDTKKAEDTCQDPALVEQENDVYPD